MKRLLSLALVLCMLILAVPVFALPALADGADPTLNFRLSPTATNGKNQVGALVSSTTVSAGVLPTNEQIAAKHDANAPYKFTADDIIGWYAWDAASWSYVNVEEYINGTRTATDGMDFYPIPKSSATVPFYNNWIAGENQVIYSSPNDDDAIKKIEAFTGGWTFALLDETEGYCVLDRVHEYSVGYAQLATYVGNPEDNDYRPVAYVGNNGQWAAPVVLTYHATKSGTVDLYLPGRYQNSGYAAVAVNEDRFINVSASLAGGGQAVLVDAALTADNAEANKFDVTNRGDIVKRTTRYANADVITLDVEAGDEIHFIEVGATNGYWYPQVVYTKLAATLDTMQVSFYESPTKSSGIDNLGTQVATYTGIDNVVIPEENENYLGWYWWDNTNKTYVEASAYLAACRAGARKIPDHTYFYPIQKDSATVPWYSGDWILGENQAIVQDGSLLAYTGGWSYAAWTDAGYATLDTVNGEKLQAGNDTTNVVNIGSSSSFASSSTTAVVLTYHATVDGTVTLGIPHAYYSMDLAVAHNDALIWPNNDADPDTAGIQPIKATNANAVANKTPVAANTSLVTDRTKRYNNLTAAIELDVKAGDEIHFMIYKKDLSVWWYPQVVYTKLAATLDTMQVSFYESPTESSGIDNLGTQVATYTGIDNVVIPEENENYLGWYWWDNTNKTYVEASAYLAACRAGAQKLLDHTYFYPIQKDSTTVPFYNNWIAGENQAIVQNGTLLAYTGGWSYGAWTDAGYATLDTVSGEKLQAGNDTTNVANIGSGGAFKSSTTSAVVLTYHVTVDGKVAVGIPHSYAYTELAIAYNGKIIWPVVDGDEATDGVQPMDIPATNQNAVIYKGHPESNTGLVADRTTRYENITATINLDVKAGETIQFMVYKDSAVYWYPQVLYTQVGSSEATVPTVETNVSIHHSLAIGLRVDATTVPQDATESGVLVDGVKADTIAVVAKDGDKTYKVQAYYVVGGETVLGEEMEITLNGLLTGYAASENEAAAATATATLAYTAAAKAYFEKGTVSVPTAPTGTYSADPVKIVTLGDDATVGFRNASLLLNDTADIKVVINAADATAYRLQISKDENFSSIIASLDGTVTEETTGNGVKFSMDEISVLDWDTVYYFRVVDTSGVVVSDTLRYGVSVYYARMQASTEAHERIKALTQVMMALAEAVNAAVAAQ